MVFLLISTAKFGGKIVLAREFQFMKKDFIHFGAKTRQDDLFSWSAPGCRVHFVLPGV